MDVLNAQLDPIRASKKPGRPETAEEKKLWKTCQEFESIMIGQVYKQMQASVKSSDPLNQGAANTTWRDMLADEQAKSMAGRGGMGLADSLYRQLHGLI